MVSGGMMKLRMFLCLLLGCCLYMAQAQGKTELCIVGTVHNPRSYFDSDTVYRILCRLEADVVLMELDSAFFDRDFRFDLERFPDLLSTNENIGAHRYQTERGALLRPFDVSGRNAWYREHRYFERQDSMWLDVLACYRKGRLDKRAQEDVDLVLQVMDYNGMKFASARDMNSSMTMGYLSLREQILYSKLLSVVEHTESLSHWQDFARLWAAHWWRRNEIMAANIRRTVGTFAGRRVVVFVGLEHKPALMRLLQGASDEWVLKEYWEY